MATVPRTNIGTVRSQLPVQRRRATAEEFGSPQIGEIAEAASDVLSASVSFAAAEKEKTDRALVRNQLNDTRSDLRNYTAEVYLRQGIDAINSYSEVEKSLSEMRLKRLNNLSTPYQKELYNASYDSLESGYLDRTIAFQSLARKAYEKTTLDAENFNVTQDAIAAYTDKEEIASSEATIVANTRYSTRGLGKDATNSAVGTAVNKFNLSILDTIEQDSPQAALNYYEQNREKFLPSVRSGLETRLKVKVEEEELRQASIALSGSGLSLEQQLAEVDKIKDKTPAQLKALRSDLKTRDKEKTDFKDAALKVDYEKEVDTLMQDPFGYQIPLSLAGDDQKKLYAFRKTLRADEMAAKGIGDKTKTNWDTYYSLRKDWASSPESFGKRDLTEFFPELANSERKELIKLQNSSRKGVDNTNLQNAANFVNNFIKSVDIDEDASVEDFKQANFIRRTFELELREYPEDQRSKLETWNRISDELFMEYDVAGTVFDAPLWKAMYGGKTLIKPDSKPPEVPKSASWDVFTENGTQYSGWSYTNPDTGVTLLYTTDGKTYRRSD